MIALVVRFYMRKARVDGVVRYSHHYSSHMQCHVFSMVFMVKIFFYSGQNYLGTAGQHLLWSCCDSYDYNKF